MQVITLYTLAVAFTIPSGTIFKVTGRARLMVVFTLPAVFALAALLVLFAHRGIVTVAWATTAVQAIGLPLTILVASRVLHVAIWQSIRAIAPPVVAVAPMVVVLLAVNHAIGTPLIALLVGLAAGGLTYLGMLLVVSRDSLERLRTLAFPGRATVRS
jgi:O-antigen/teichoic acid export membrane protein